MIPANAPIGVKLAPIFDPIITAKAENSNGFPDNPEMIDVKVIVIGMLFRRFAKIAELMPYAKMLPVNEPSIAFDISNPILSVTSYFDNAPAIIKKERNYSAR